MFGMVLVYLADSPQIISTVFAARRQATLYLRHGRLSFSVSVSFSAVHKVMIQSLWYPLLDEFKKTGESLRERPCVPSQGHPWGL